MSQQQCNLVQQQSTTKAVATAGMSANEGQRSAKAEQSYARRQKLHVRNAILKLLKRALIFQEVADEPQVSLTSLAHSLNEKFIRDQGQPLSEKIGE